MTLSQTNSFYISLLAITAVTFLFPNSALAQEEPIKKISLTISLNEKAAESFVQLPANNLPVTIDKAVFKKRVYTKRPVSSNRNTAKVVTTPAAAKPEKSISKNTPTVLRPKISTNTQLIAKETIPKRTVAAKTPAQPAKRNAGNVMPNITAPANSKPKDNSQVSLQKSANGQQTAVNNLKPSSKEIPEKPFMVTESKKKDSKYLTIESPSSPYVETIATTGKVDKQNTLSYVWIGSILVIAGLVLGLLFGRAAFLLSLVGVIFIILGVVVF